MSLDIAADDELLPLTGGGVMNGHIAQVPNGESAVAYFVPKVRGACSHVYERHGDALVFAGISKWPPKFDEIEPLTEEP